MKTKLLAVASVATALTLGLSGCGSLGLVVLGRAAAARSPRR